MSLEKEIQKLLLSNSPINNQKSFDIFYAYLQDCDPTKIEDTQIFDIVINYFKPEKVNISLYKPKEQREKILEILNATPEKDKDIENFLKQMSELEQRGQVVKGDITSGKQGYSNFLGDVKRIQDPKNQTQVENYRADNFEINEVQFEFEIKELPKDGKVQEQEEEQEDTRRQLTYKITDPLTGISRRESIIIAHEVFAGHEKSTLISNYMDERPNLIKKKQSSLATGIKNLEKQSGMISNKQFQTQTYKEQYENFKASMENQYSDKRRDTVTGMRDAYRQNFRQKES